MLMTVAVMSRTYCCLSKKMLAMYLSCGRGVYPTTFGVYAGVAGLSTPLAVNHFEQVFLTLATFLIRYGDRVFYWACIWLHVSTCQYA